MSARVVETRELSAAEQREREREQADLRWWQAHAPELLRAYPGKYVVVLDGQTIVGNTPGEVYAKADSVAPDRMPCLHHLSSGKGPRLYGGLRVVARD